MFYAKYREIIFKKIGFLRKEFLVAINTFFLLTKKGKDYSKMELFNKQTAALSRKCTSKITEIRCPVTVT